MVVLPEAAEPLVSRFSIAFSRPTFERFIILSIGAIVAMGRRTTTALLWATRTLAEGHSSSYHRVFSRSPWPARMLAKVLAGIVLELVPADQRVVLSVDDTTARHGGRHVYGKGCHHDAVRSTHTHVVWKWGHKWVVLAINVKFPFAHRPWALPVLCTLYKTAELNKTEGHRHRTPVALTMIMVACLMRWFPDRPFVLLGDGGYASHELARFAARRRRRLTLVSLFHGDANLYNPPPARRRHGPGRRPIRGAKRASPGQVVDRSKPTPAAVGWYGGGDRRIEFVSEKAHWYKGGSGLVELRWVFVHDKQGTHRDQYFYSTDPTMTPPQIVTLYTARWSIEVTFQEVREHLGFETTKQHCRKSVLRTGPWLLGLYSMVTLVYARLIEGRKPILHATDTYRKTEPTFSDALYAVRLVLWEKTILQQAIPAAVVSKISKPFKTFLLDQLAVSA